MANSKKDKSMESILWSACDKLRGAVEPSEYKHVILSLIFLKPCPFGHNRSNDFRYLLTVFRYIMYSI